MITVSISREDGAASVPALILGPVEVVPGAAVPVELDLEALMGVDSPHRVGSPAERSWSWCGPEAAFSYLMEEHRLTCSGSSLERVLAL